MVLSRILLLLFFMMNVSSAMEIRSPVCPVSYGNLPCIINGTNSPGLLEDYEMIYLDTSKGNYLAGDNFYYAGINHKNYKIDLFSKEYNIVSINSMQALLITDIYKNVNNLQIRVGNELKLKDGYILEFTDTEKDSAFFSLKRNGEILEVGSTNRNGIFSYTTHVNGREVEIFRTTLTGIFGSSTVIKNTYLRNVKVINNGESYGDYEITLKDINGDGNIDIVYSLKNKKIDPDDNEIIQILDGFLGLRTYPAYVPFYKSLDSFNLTADDGKLRIYSLNNNLTMPVTSFLNSPPEGSIIASGIPAGIIASPAIVYNESNSSIAELRGDHTFYIYTKGNLSLSVIKQDLNWYYGSDSLEVKLYSPSGGLLKKITITDDGNTGNNNTRGVAQNGILEASLEEGMYKVAVTGGSDILIRNIGLNSGKIVVQKPYLAGGLYNNATRFNLYTRALKGDMLGFHTSHNNPSVLPQIVNISSGSFAQSSNITKQKLWYHIFLPPGNELYQIYLQSGDIMVNSSSSYFSFSSDSYFDPEPVKIFPLQNNKDWLNKNKVDYVIIPSSNPFKASYFFKNTVSQKFNIISPESPWIDYTIDTWSAPNIFYFNPDENNTWEYLIINNTGMDTDVKYVSIQNNGYAGYLGDLYRVVYETPGELILSKKISDINNKTLFLDREWQIGGTYTLILKDIDKEGSAVLQLNCSNKPVSKQIIHRGNIMEYNIPVKGKDAAILELKLDGIFNGTGSSFVKLSDIKLYDENMIAIKNGGSIGNYKTSLLDLNKDGFLDILVRPESNIQFEKNSRKTLIKSYLDMIFDENTFHVERIVSSPPAIIDTSNIKKEIKYTFVPFLPQYNALLIFPDFDIRELSINSVKLIDQINVD
ncbi:MAG TPA: S-layer protein domain-containing protein, partial [Candidatus Methylomirabilis sp.]|nr:S-layer protein domain-containing protein [Candidatus Methylomirabilis sp.]